MRNFCVSSDVEVDSLLKSKLAAERIRNFFRDARNRLDSSDFAVLHNIFETAKGASLSFPWPSLKEVVKKDANRST